jgi:hypothetical protein
MPITKTEQANRIILGLFDTSPQVTIARAKAACGPDLPTTFALWGLRKRGDIQRVAPGTYERAGR